MDKTVPRRERETPKSGTERPIVRSLEGLHPRFVTTKARKIGQCEGCGRIGEVEEYSVYFTPFPDGRTVFCGGCVGMHLEGTLWW